MALHRGWFRVWVVLSILWCAGVVVLASSEYRAQNAFCQFNPWQDAGDSACDPALWEWRRGQTKLFVRDVSNDPSVQLVFLPRTEKMLSLLVGAPLALFLLGAAVGWVRRGFRSERP
jgi:hypothetical protein